MATENITDQIKTKVKDANPYREEGKLATKIEAQTSKIPSDAFLWSSVGIMATSLALKILKQDRTALFVGQWAAPLLIMGLYNKVVKVSGHDQLNDLPA